MLTTFVRSVLLYVFAVLAMRLMGKRQIGQMQPYELVVVMMIAELVTMPMTGAQVPMLDGVLPVAALMICHGLIDAACMRLPKFRSLMCGQPAILVRNGVICEKQLRKHSVHLNDLMEAMRVGGVMDPKDVGAAILETGGQVTVFPSAQARTVTMKDMHLPAGEEPLPLPLVMDGRVHHQNLQRGGVTAAQLQKGLSLAGVEDASQVLLATLGGDGVMHLQRKGDEQTRRIHLMDEKQAVW